jgi:hypothetical protein
MESDSAQPSKPPKPSKPPESNNKDQDDKIRQQQKIIEKLEAKLAVQNAEHDGLEMLLQGIGYYEDICPDADDRKRVALAMKLAKTVDQVTFISPNSAPDSDSDWSDTESDDDDEQKDKKAGGGKKGKAK